MTAAALPRPQGQCSTLVMAGQDVVSRAETLLVHLTTVDITHSGSYLSCSRSVGTNAGPDSADASRTMQTVTTVFMKSTTADMAMATMDITDDKPAIKMILLVQIIDQAPASWI